MDVQQKWDEMCEAYGQEQWDRLEAAARAVRELVSQGKIPNVSGHKKVGGLDKAMAKAGVDFIIESHFSRSGQTP